MVKEDKLQFGIAIPQIFTTGKIDPSIIPDFLAKAEALGYRSGWVMDQGAGTAPTLDPTSLLSYAAAFGGQLRLGTSVMLTALQGPVPLAKSLATLDQLSKGRLILGVGIGTNTRIYPAYGISAKGRASRFEEGIHLMKALWGEDKVTFQGRFWQMDDMSITPKPFQKPHPPIWFGGQAPVALRRAAKLGDGWMGAGYSSTGEFKEAIKLVRGYMDEEGRDPAAFPLSKRVYVAVDRDKKRASQKLQEWFGHVYRNPARALEVAVFGNEEECIDGLGEVVSQGIELLMLNPVYDMMEQSERLARDVLPKL